MSRTIFAVAAVFVSLQLVPTPAVAQYYASAPWCAVISLGAGDVHWECLYRSIEECRSTILAATAASAIRILILSPPLSAPVVPVRISCVRSCNEVR